MALKPENCLVTRVRSGEQSGDIGALARDASRGRVRNPNPAERVTKLVGGLGEFPVTRCAAMPKRKGKAASPAPAGRPAWLTELVDKKLETTEDNLNSLVHFIFLYLLEMYCVVCCTRTAVRSADHPRHFSRRKSAHVLRIRWH